jgi:hypothetical protein
MYSTSNILGLIELAYFAVFASVAFIVWKNTKHPWARALGTLFVIGLGLAYPVKIALERKAFRDTRAAAEAHFRKMCETKAGEWMYSRPETVNGVVLLRPRSKASDRDLRDQHWTGDPYGYSPFEVDPIGFLVTPNHPVLAFVEVFVSADASASVGSGWLRYEVDSTNPSQISVRAVPIPYRTAQYGFTWRDISTPEDREHWVAGGEMALVEIATGTVVARRVGYIWNYFMGGLPDYSLSWLLAGDARRSHCPSFESSGRKAMEFLSWALSLESPRGIGRAK